MSKTEPFKERFSGFDAWAKLTTEQQDAIGEIALELVVAWFGERWRPEGFDNPFPWDDPPETFHQAEYRIRSLLFIAVAEPLAEDFKRFEQDGTPVPSFLGQCCRICGCSWFDPCAKGCAWAEEDLCTNCAGPGAPAGDAA